MRKSARSWKERICALLLAAAMVVTWMMPNAALTAEAAPGDGSDTVDVYFTVQDAGQGDRVLTNDVKITVYDENERVAEVKNPEQNGQHKDAYKVKGLTAGTEYTYTVEKTGYEYADTADKRKFMPSADDVNANDLTVKMQMQDIAVNPSSLTLKVGDSSTVQVTNKVEELSYTWQVTSGSEYVDVDNGQITAKAGNASIDADQSATVTVSAGNKSKEIPVTIQKNDVNMSLSIVEQTGVDQNKVTLRANGLPDDATGNLTFKVGTSTIKTVNAARSRSVEYSSEDLIGSKTFSVGYTGDTKYKSANASATGTYTKTQELKIKNSESTTKVIYDEDSWNEPIVITLDSDSIKGRTISAAAKFADPDAAYNSGDASNVANIVVDQTAGIVTVTPQNAGDIKIVITADRGDTDYETATAEYTLTVERKTIDINDVTWDKVSKVYDGNTGIKLTGTVNGTSEKITIDAEKANVASKDVAADPDKTPIAQNVSITSGTYYATVESGTANNKLVVEDSENTVENIATINYRPLYLTAGNARVDLAYGQDMKKAIEETEGLISLLNDNGIQPGQDDTGDDTGLVEGEKTPQELPGATIEGGDTRLHLGDHKIIVPNITAANKISGNYEFKFEDNEAYKGTVTVSRQVINQKQLMESIVLTDTAGLYGITEGESLEKIFASVNGEGIYGENTENPTVKLTLNKSTDLGRYYDYVFISINNENAVNATEDDGISLDILKNLITDKTDDQKVDDVKIYLGRNDWENTTTNEVNMADWLYIDNKAPVAAIDELTPTAYSEMGNAITFGLFKHKVFNANITVTDEGSGIAVNSSQQYYVWKLGKDITDDDLTKTAVKTKIESITAASEWTDLELADDGTATIPVGEGESAEAVENNYIILIKTIDNADNSSVYVSNGMVIDIKVPTISCTFESENQQFNTGDVLGYSDDANYELTIEDPGDYFSGIDKFEVKITENGKNVNTPETITEIDDSAVYENSFIYEPEDKDGYSYAELKEGSKLVINGRITADDITSNNVVMTVTATDRAEKTSEVFTQKLYIDKNDPVLKVSFDKTNEETNGLPVQEYYQDSRTMTVSYTERNLGFDVDDSFTLDKVAKDNIWFDVMLENGQEYEYSLAEMDEGFDGEDLIDVELVKDTEEGKGEDNYTDGRTVTFNLLFKGQNEYTVTPHCKDELNNEVTGTTEYFVVDTEAPEITGIEYTSFNEESQAYEPFDPSEPQNTTIRMAVTVKEHYFMLDDDSENFVDGQIDLALEAADRAEGDDTDYQAQYKEEADLKENWSTVVSQTSEDEWKITFEFDYDANYTMNLTYKDLSGKACETGEQKFTYDATNPTGSITVTTNDDTNVWRTLLNALTFGAFDKFSNSNSIPVSLTGEDVTAGVAKIQYYNSTSPKTYDEIAALSESSWKDGTSYNMDADQQFVPYLKVTDRAGNVEYISTTSGFIADQTKPQITITEANRNAASNGIYNEDVKLNVSVEDPTNGGTYSGLKSVTYQIQASGNVSTSENGTLHTAAQDVQSHKTVNGTITVDAEKFNSNDVKVTVYATDFSGNTYSKDISLKIDVTEPTINVTYDLNSPLNDRYYNATRTASVTVTERNFDPSAVRFNITNTDGTQPSISGWSHSSNSGVSDSATHTCTVTFAADGDYTFTLNTTDLAGNASNYTRVDDFTIDQTDPTIQVSYDNNNDAEPGYFNADRTATITVTEHNFNAADVNTAITASLEGRGVATPGLSGWSTRGDVHTASVTFSADADYTFDVDYTDLAGNAASDYEQDSFTVDQTVPELEFFDIEDKSANNDVVAPGVRYSDNNYTENGVEITLEGANHGEMTVDGDRSSIPNGESIKMADFERTKETDDLYTMTAVIRDRAGNETEDSVIFSVNRFGSVYILSDETQDLVDNYYTNEEQDLVVTEINVDSLVFNGISYGRDGQLVNLQAGTDYEVKASGSEVSWKQYDYTINKENFEKEGNYTVTIDSEDRATNVGNSRAKGCDIEFAIDKTAPTVVITGIENNAQYRANTRNIAVNAADNIAMGDVEVFVGDKPAQSYDAKDIQAAGGELTYTMSSSNSRQDIKAVATDAAGNTAEAEITRVLLTSNLFVQFYSNTPLLVGTIVGVVVIAGGLLWFFLIFKRKKDEEQANK